MRFIIVEKWAIRLLFITIFLGISSSIFKINTIYSEQLKNREMSDILETKEIADFTKPSNTNKFLNVINSEKLLPKIDETNGITETSVSTPILGSRNKNSDMSSFISTEENKNYLISKNIPLAFEDANQAQIKHLLRTNLDLPLLDNKDINNGAGSFDSEFNYFETQQWGSENNAGHELISGSKNFSRIVQFGNNNFARHVISQDFNIIQTFQSGDLNFSDIVTNSSGNAAIINQNGSNNRSTIKQSGMR